MSNDSVEMNSGVVTIVQLKLKHRILLAFALIFILVIGNTTISWGPAVRSLEANASQGLLDLRGLSLDNQLYRLDGEWLLYHGLLASAADELAASGVTPVVVRVPGGWDRALNPLEGRTPFGAGTYRLRILLPSMMEGVFGIYMHNVRTAHKLYVNGVLVGNGGGEPAYEAASEKSVNIPYSVYFPVQGSMLELILPVSNYSYGIFGGIFKSIEFGTASAVESKKLLAWLTEWTTVTVLFLFMMLFVAIYAARRRLETLYLAAFACFFLLYTVTHGEKLLWTWLPDISYDLWTRIQFCSSLSLYFFVLFLRKSYPSMLGKIGMLSIHCTAGGLLLIYLSLPVEVYSRYEPAMVGIVFVLSLSVIGWMIRTAWKGAGDSVFMLLAAICLLSIQLQQMMYLAGIRSFVPDFQLEMIILILIFITMTMIRYMSMYDQMKRDARALIRMDKLKDEFIAETSYQLRMPLSNMLQSLQNAVNRIPAESSVSGELANVLAAGRRMEHLLDDLLDLSLLKEDRIVLQRRAVQLESVLAHLAEIAPYVHEGEPMKIVSELPEQLPMLYADEMRLVQVLVNVLYDAAAYIRPTGAQLPATIRAVPTSDGQVAITLSLQAEGTVGQDSMEARTEHAGLDTEAVLAIHLQICRRIVELHGGRFSHDAQNGRRFLAVFTIPIASECTVSTDMTTLPITNAKAQGAAVFATPHITGTVGASRILCVDDDPEHILKLVAVFAGEPYEMVLVSNAEQAETVLAQGKVELVLLDAMLPSRSGYELCRLIRQQHSLVDLPVIMLTGNRQNGDALAGFRAGANDYVQKPIDQEELRVRAGTLLKLKASALEHGRLELAYRQAQIKPHFLFNALNSIAALVDADPEQARELLSDFSLYLRVSFDTLRQEGRISLAKELELVEAYIRI